MYVELMYLGVAYLASVLILYKFAWPEVKFFLNERSKIIEDQINTLSEELEESKQVQLSLEASLKSVKQKAALLSESMPKMSAEKRKSLEIKHIELLKQYKLWCEQKFIEEVKHNKLVEMKTSVVRKIIEELALELKKQDKGLNKTIDTVLQAYVSHLKEEEKDVR